jgi:hypothetical protein
LLLFLGNFEVTKKEWKEDDCVHKNMLEVLENVSTIFDSIPTLLYQGFFAFVYLFDKINNLLRL